MFVQEYAKHAFLDWIKSVPVRPRIAKAFIGKFIPPLISNTDQFPYLIEENERCC